MCPKLEILTLLSEGFEELKLTELNMGHCDSLNHEEALKIIIKIDTLTSLNLTSWKMGSLPEGIGEQLVNLADFNLHGCVKLQELPESICNMRFLTRLDLSGDSGWRCQMSLRALPERFGELNLTEIDFSWCEQLDLGVIFDVIFKFEGLTKLGLAGLNMESLPERKP